MNKRMNGKKSIRQRLQEWYQGTYVPPPPNDPDSHVVFISPGHYEQTPLAKAVKLLGAFWLKHWQWITGTALAVIGIVVSLK